MAKVTSRSYSRYTRQALGYLGDLVRAGRLERGINAAELAERAGISRDMLYRIEKGDPRCEIGVVFELAAIVGVALFESEEVSTLHARHRELTTRLTLLPKSVRSARKEVNDDF